MKPAVHTLIFLSSLLIGFTPRLGEAAEVTHEVVVGESLAEIANRYGVTVTQVRRKNRLKSNLLKPGQRLRIHTKKPSRSQFRARYEVKRGDSLARIAKKHGMKLSQLKRMNGASKGTLKPGQRLWVVKRGPVRRGQGSSRKLYRLESYAGFKVLNPSRAFGTMYTIDRLTEVLFRHHLQYPDAHPLLIGDLSRKRGGYLPPHKSHRTGRDVDIRYPLLEPNTRYVAATRETLDVPRTWNLIQSLIETGDVIYVFVDYRLQRILYDYAKKLGTSEDKLRQYFQFPRRRRAMVGIIRHEKGHRTHIHVRFRKQPRKTLPTS